MSKVADKNKSKGDKISNDDVVAYLQQNPTFFIDNEALLADLDFPHQLDTISIFHRQIQQLRARNDANNIKLGELVEQAVSNEHQLQRFRQLFVSLTLQSNLPALASTLTEQIDAIFGLKLAELLFVANAANKQVGEEVKQCKDFLNKKTKRKDVICTRLSRPERDLLNSQLSEQGRQLGVKHLQSIALLKLGNHGFCVLGSEDDDHFNASLSTLFLDVFADVLQALIKRLNQSSQTPAQE